MKARRIIIIYYFGGWGEPDFPLHPWIPATGSSDRRPPRGHVGGEGITSMWSFSPISLHSLFFPVSPIVLVPARTEASLLAT